jgi:hypothetical protein
VFGLQVRRSRRAFEQWKHQVDSAYQLGTFHAIQRWYRSRFAKETGAPRHAGPCVPSCCHCATGYIEATGRPSPTGSICQPCKPAGNGVAESPM